MVNKESANANSIAMLMLMFDETDTICVSDSQYAYHAIPINNVCSNNITLVSSNGKIKDKKTELSNITLVSLNPIRGFRSDAACYQYKNFLVELDIGTKESQVQYVKHFNTPFSAMVWSGSKSVHTIISLTESLPNEAVYRFIAKWALNILSLADPNTFNPSRSIRLAGSIRPETGQTQELIEIRKRITICDLVNWLKQYPDSRPKKYKKATISDKLDISRIKTPWVANALINGLEPTKGRNKQWFAISCEFALANYSEDDTIDILGQFFVEEHDFKEKEWLIAVRSGHKYIRNNK